MANGSCARWEAELSQCALLCWSGISTVHICGSGFSAKSRNLGLDPREAAALSGLRQSKGDEPRGA